MKMVNWEQIKLLKDVEVEMELLKDERKEQKMHKDVQYCVTLAHHPLTDSAACLASSASVGE